MTRTSSLFPVLVLSLAGLQIACASCKDTTGDSGTATDSGSTACTLAGVAFTSPADGATIDPADNVSLRAELSGSGIDAAALSVVFTFDGLPIDNWEWDGTDVVLNGPAGAGAHSASVSVTDGCSTFSDEVSWVGNSAPSVTLSANGSYELGDPIVIGGNVGDSEDSISSLVVVWNLDGSFYAEASPDGASGDVSLDLTGLPVGSYSVELSATDFYDESTASAGFDVSEDPIICQDMPNPSMVLHMDEGSGDILGDASLHAQQATLNGDYSWTDGAFGAGVDLAGTGWIEVADPAYPTLWSTDYTLSGWLSRNGDELTTNEALVQQTDGQYSDAVGRTLVYLAPECGGKTNVLVSNVGEGKVCGNTSITNDGWHHVAVVRDRARTAVDIYLDGVLDGSGTEYMTFADGGYLFGTNKTADNNFFNGVVDEWAIANQALTPSEIAALATGPTCEPTCAPLPANASAWLPMDDGAGAVAADASGNGFDFDLVGGASFGEGTFAGGLELDGVNGYAIATAGNYPDLNTQSFTVSVRARFDAEEFPTATDGQDFVLVQTGNGDDGQGRSLLYVDSSCGGQASTFIGGSELCAGTLRAGVWYHLAVSYDAVTGETKLYVDGGLKATDTRTIEAANGDLWLGRTQHGSDDSALFWDGPMDDVIFFDSVLTAEDVLALHQGASAYCLAP